MLKLGRLRAREGINVMISLKRGLCPRFKEIITRLELPSSDLDDLTSELEVPSVEQKLWCSELEMPSFELEF